MARSMRAFGDRMLQAMLPKAEARASHICKRVGAQCWKNCKTGCTGCNYGGPSCGCTEWVNSCG
ncbi:hypothetical protein [Plantactinospora sp. GCM10030261]|uniref:hypothetical protein n=1 Tax=Plantactinospora sp. GCM10030261 TaxID=3273420 RepID=UPI00361D5B76